MMADDNGTQHEDGTEPEKVSDADPNAGQPKTEGSDDDGNGLPAAFGEALAGLGSDNREWLTKQGYTMTPEGIAKLAKQVREQAKLIGGSIRIPGKDATEEERNAFLDRLGRPKSAEAYDLPVPENLPEDLPYNGERANEFKGVAHKMGLTQSQIAGLHDWFVGSAVNDHQASTRANGERDAVSAKTATATLEKAWGPLSGETFQQNMALGHRALTDVGGPELKAAFEARGLIGKDGVILDASIAQFMAKIGGAFYKEGDMLKGDPGRTNNPFSDDHDNMTEQMRIMRSDPEAALSLIAAAGKKPEDFGLTRK